MELHYLEIFNTVAQYQNYRKASEVLHISQPALSTEMRRLESQIGLALFDRVGNRIVLNENGAMLQRYTARIFEVVGEMESAISRAKHAVGGTLELAASNTPASCFLPGLMTEFQKLYPETRFCVSVGNTSEIAQMVSSGAVELGINGGRCSYDACIAAEKLLDDRLVLIAAPQNPLAKLPLVHSEDLRAAGFVMHKTNSQLYTYYQRLAAQYGLAENIVMSLGSIELIKNAVMADTGISLISALAVRREVQKGWLCILNAELQDMDYPYSLIVNKNKALSFTAVKFMDFLRAKLAGPLA